MASLGDLFKQVAQNLGYETEEQSGLTLGQMLQPSGPTGNGLRNDGTMKGSGYWGPILRPDGGVSTEFSIGVEMDGREVEIPTIVPTLTQDELSTLMTLEPGTPVPEPIVQKAVDFARQRMAQGRSPFLETGNLPAPMARMEAPAIMNPPPAPTETISSNAPALPPTGAIWSPSEQEKAAFAAEAAPRPGEEGLWGWVQRAHRVANAPIPGANPEVPTGMAGMEGVILTEVAPGLLGRTAGGGMETLKAPGSRPRESAIVSEPVTAPPFYSRLRRVVEDPKTQGKQTGSQWLSFLQGPKRGVKADEMKWTGLDSFLKERSGERVTRDQILEHLASNEIQVVDVTKGATRDGGWTVVYPDNIQHRWFPTEEAAKRHAAEVGGEAWQASEGEAIRGDTKFSQYTLPGAENYREVLLQLPHRDAGILAREKVFARYRPQIQRLTQEIQARSGLMNPRQVEPLFREREALEAKMEAEAKAAGGEPTGAETFHAGHWDEPNVLAHLRLSDRTTDGKKTLLVEEIQSDWAQKGRKEGFALRSEETTPLDAEYRRLVHQNAAAREQGREPNPADVARARELEVALERSDKSKIPVAPFVESTSDWVRLGLKRVLKMAADEGYDRVGIVRGKEQADRYNLAKQVDILEWEPSTNLLFAFKDGSEILRKEVPKEKLAETVGKEAAERLLTSDKDYQGRHNLRGEQLEVGGEGMKSFYDQIVPQELDKLGKEYGIKVVKEGTNVETPTSAASGKWTVIRNGTGDVLGTFPSKMEAIEAMDAEAQMLGVTRREYSLKQAPPKTPVHSIDIPPEAREKIKREGFPIISRYEGMNLGQMARNA